MTAQHGRDGRELGVYRWWSPYVPVGRTTDAFAQLEQTWKAKGRDLRFIINQDCTACITQLIESAWTNSATTNEPAYRLLQNSPGCAATSPSCRPGAAATMAVSTAAYVQPRSGSTAAAARGHA